MGKRQTRGKSPTGPNRATRAGGLAAALALGLAIGLAFLPLAPAQARDGEAAAGRTSAVVKISIGKSESVRTDGAFSEVIVSDPEIADAIPLTDRSVSILGKKIGTARVSMYGEGKKLVGVYDIEVAYDTSRLSVELSQRFPSARFRVSSVNGRIMLAGTAPDSLTVDKALTIAKQFGADVINSMRVTSPQQVMLEVRFVEASRTASRDLGVNWQAVQQQLANTGTNGISLTTGIAGLTSGATPFGTLVGSILGSGMKADVLVKALEQRGIVRRLAEPNLIALSGDTASFLAGGEFPIPVASTLGQVSIEFKKYGVGLAFTPTVLDDGQINLKIEPEVSQIDPTTTIQLNGIVIPALIVRRANTTVELRDGQSFAIAGLLQGSNTMDQQQLPWIGDVPVLGALARSAAFQKKETDLVIIVTPHLVRPARPGDPLRTPLDNSLPANDPDLYLLGQAEITKPIERRLKGISDGRHPPLGHILDVPKPAQAVVPGGQIVEVKG
ncbi:MAG: type II and III secretion system protein family protein [Alphaproteobacteria bacterium]|nr:type II and III secretion system protein family protein [Alphaproteobacteria bacterium]